MKPAKRQMKYMGMAYLMTHFIYFMAARCKQSMYQRQIISQFLGYQILSKECKAVKNGVLRKPGLVFKVSVWLDLLKTFHTCTLVCISYTVHNKMDTFNKTKEHDHLIANAPLLTDDH